MGHQHKHSISQWVSSRDSAAASSDLEGSKRPNLFDTLRSELLQVSGLDIKQ